MTTQSDQRAPLLAMLQERSVLLCVGAGGVGKTTVSASLALRAALEGRRALVCTIDPAKRLANALGLRELGNAETQIPAEHLRAAGLSESLPLFAMMLDMKQTWDEFIERNARPEQRRQIFENRFYRSLSSVLAGSQEYIAMEKLWQLKQQRDYPLVVLDTPPSIHAMDFLEAPTRVLDFLGSDAAGFLLAPALAAGKFGLSLFKRSTLIARSLSRFTGVDMLQELANFLLVLSGLRESFRTRASQVQDLLQSPGTAFVIVTGPAPERIGEALQFFNHLGRGGYAIAAVVVNRVQAAPGAAIAEELSHIPYSLRAKVEVSRNDAQVMADRDTEGLRTLAHAISPTPLVQVPQIHADVHPLAGLEQTARYLAGTQLG